jgi:molecular chaperone DnaJ
MSKRDYYAVLGVAKNASTDEIKRSYRKMAMKHHPDRNREDKNAQAKFQEIQEAYAVLSDAKKRAAYDQLGHEGVASAGAGGFNGFNVKDVGDIFGDIFGAQGDGIFGDIFGRQGTRRGRSSGQRGADLVYELHITLEEAFHGVVKEIKISAPAVCSSCRGSGARKGSGPVKCAKCDGSGVSSMQHGFITMQQPCSTCRGQGTVIKDPCPQCHGQGRVQERKTLSVKIPAGVDNGDRIRLTGEGEAGRNGGSSGDLYVQIHVKKHPIFHREGTDLLTEVPISFDVAVLGGQIDIPTLEGHVSLKIPAETQTGKMFRLRGKGIKSIRRHAPGDLLCRVVVETPIRLNEEQRDRLKSFFKLLSEDQVNHSPKSLSWVDNVKNFFHKMRH